MFCKNCGTNLPDGTAFCTSCGANQTAGTPATNNAVNNPAPTYQAQPSPVKEDKINIGLNILSWFIPIFGIIYYFVKRNERPKEAKGTLKTALISCGVNFVIILVSMVIIFAGAFSVIGGLTNELGDIPNDIEEYEDYDPDYNDIYEEYETTETTTETSTQSGFSNVNASSDWSDYTVYVSGKAIKLPISWADFSKQTGATFNDPQDAQQTLKSNYYTVVTVKDAQGRNFCVKIMNDTNDVKTLVECTIIGISDFKRYSEGGQADLVFAGNLKVEDNITEAELKQLFGEPDDTWYSSDGKDYKYTYYEDYDTYYSSREFTITVYDGVIHSLDLEKSA